MVLVRNVWLDTCRCVTFRFSLRYDKCTNIRIVCMCVGVCWDGWVDVLCWSLLCFDGWVGVSLEWLCMMLVRTVWSVVGLVFRLAGSNAGSKRFIRYVSLCYV